MFCTDMAFHPNSHLDDDTVLMALNAVSPAFLRCHMKPLRPPEDLTDCNSLMFGELGKKRFLVYVRVTLEDETEEGTGPTPPILIDSARQLGCEPHLVRVHMRKVHGGTGFEYFGYEEFIEAVLSNSKEWTACLLRGKTVSHFLRLLGGRRSEITLGHQVKHEPPEAPEIVIWLRIDGTVPFGGTFDLGALLSSTRRSDEHPIFTCSCGVPECARIDREITVVHEGELTLWKAYYARPRKIFVFDRSRYQERILSAARAAMDAVAAMGATGVVPYAHNPECLERAFFDATGDRH